MESAEEAGAWIAGGAPQAPRAEVEREKAKRDDEAPSRRRVRRARGGERETSWLAWSRRARTSAITRLGDEAAATLLRRKIEELVR